MEKKKEYVQELLGMCGRPLASGSRMTGFVLSSGTIANAPTIQLGTGRNTYGLTGLSSVYTNAAKRRPAVTTERRNPRRTLNRRRKVETPDECLASTTQSVNWMVH